MQHELQRALPSSGATRALPEAIYTRDRLADVEAARAAQAAECTIASWQIDET